MPDGFNSLGVNDWVAPKLPNLGVNDWSEPTPPREPAPESEPPSAPQSQAKADINAAAQGPILGAGAAIAGAGDIFTAAGAQGTRRQLAAMDAIDQGRDVPQDQDPAGYQFLSADQRAKARADFSAADTELSKREPNALTRAGEAVEQWGRDTFPVAPENEGLQTGAARAVTGMVPLVLASIFGGPVGTTAAMASMFPQGYHSTLKEAKDAGASPEDAEAAAAASAALTTATMMVPLSRVMQTIPVRLRPGLAKTLVDLGEKGVEFASFNALSAIANNYVAKQSFAPDRPLLQGVPQAAAEGFIAGPVLHGVGLGVTAAANRLPSRPNVQARVAPDPAILEADTLDTAIDAANKVASGSGSPPDVATEATPTTTPGTPVDVRAETERLSTGDSRDLQTAALLKLFDHTGQGTVEQDENGGYHYRTTDANGAEITHPIEVWHPSAEQDAAPGTSISTETAAAIQDHYGQAGVNVVFYKQHPGISFDGAHDPNQPDTIFLSSDPARLPAQVAGHEFTHVLQTTTLPDGTSLGELLNQQIAAGITPAGQRYAEKMFGSTAPVHLGPEAVQAHLINELGTDIGGEAPKFQSFLPRVMDAIQQRYGDTVAGDVLRKLLDGLRSAMETIRGLFGETGTRSQNWVTNIGEIHDTFAKMYAQRFGSPVEREQARLAAMKDRAERARATSEPAEQRPSPVGITPEADQEQSRRRVERLKDVARAQDALEQTPLPTGWELSPDPKSTGYVVYDHNDQIVGRGATMFEALQDGYRAAGSEPGTISPVVNVPSVGTAESQEAVRGTVLRLRRWLDDLAAERDAREAATPTDGAVADTPEMAKVRDQLGTAAETLAPVESTPAPADYPYNIGGYTDPAAIAANRIAVDARNGKITKEDAARQLAGMLARGEIPEPFTNVQLAAAEIDRDGALWNNARAEAEAAAPPSNSLVPPPPTHPEPIQPSPDARAANADHALAERIATRLDRQRVLGVAPMTARELQTFAEQAYGGTLAQGAYSRDRLYDAIELGVNRYIQSHPERFNPAVDAAGAETAARELAALKDSLPTQTVRAGEKDAYQQFSTPPDYAFAANWVANLRPTDHVLEPSAGVGGLIVHAMNAGVRETTVNELSDKRRGMIAALNPTRTTGEDAAQLHNILPDDVRPTVVVMNPPFSRAAERMGGRMVLDEGAKHIEQALARLEPGGRLVAIVGDGMKPEGTPSQGTAREGTGRAFREWWAKIGAEYDVRANVGVDRDIYTKYGTSFPTRLLVIDKNTPSGRPMVTGQAHDAAGLIERLQGVRDERGPDEQLADQPGGPEMAPGGEGVAGPDRELHSPTGGLGAGEGDRGDTQPDLGEPAGTSQPGVGGGRPAGIGGSEGGTGEPVVPVQPKPGTRGAGRKPRPATGPSGDAGGGRDSGGGDGVRPDGSGERDEPGLTPAPESVLATENAVAAPDNQEVSEAVYEPYAPQRVQIVGARPHPGALVQSAAMASVMPPATDYKPRIPAALVRSGALSDAQLEAIVYAGHAHSDVMANGKRRGFFIGDGTGVGKGREIAGIILDNFQNGRTKAVWVSEKRALVNDARRDWNGMGRPATDVIDHGKLKPGDAIKGDKGILFTSYDTMKSAEQTKTVDGKIRGKERVDQIVDWVGKDFDGVIAFDESHNMGNATDQKGGRGVKKASQKALAGLKLQEALPNARVVYVSATGATEVSNLAYADRLGLWGEGTAFANRNDFTGAISSGGIAGMELVARDMKALGHYIARNLSYDGVDYDRVEHVLNEDQRSTYDKLAEGWQLVLQHFNAALEATGVTEDGKTKNSRAKSAAMSAFWGGHQRFFNQIITSMQMPSVIRGVEADLKAGRQAVLQLVNTMEAAQERALEKARASGEGEIEDLDMTPRDQLMQLIEKSYPVQQMEEYQDDNGNIRSRPAVDSEGKPVLNREAVAARDRLLDQIGSIRVPDGPLEMLMNHFGTDKVAEVTGRKQRVVRQMDEGGQMKTVVEQRGGSANVADASSFQQGKKPILVFSEAGGTGRSYHAENGSGSEDARRSHYLVQGGWRADKAVQGFGRTHRTNQASAPIFHLVTTDLQGQKRFISSIARRLSQLGALTKGERRAADQGMFGMRDNLESTEARDGLTQFFRDVNAGAVEGVSMDDLEHTMGLKMRDENGALASPLPEMSQFLNRVLSLKVDHQNQVFNAFSDRMDLAIARASAAGTLDTGVETYQADKISKISEQTVYTDPRSGAETKHVHLNAQNRNTPVSFQETLAGRNKTNGAKPDSFIQNVRSGRVFAVTSGGNYTDADGRIIAQVRLTSPIDYQFADRNKIDRDNWKKLTTQEAKPLWDQQVASTPEFRNSALHIITGAVLPIWDRLGGNPKIFRLQTDQGERMLGRVIPAARVDATLRSLGAEGIKVTASPGEIAQQVLNGATAKLANEWTIKRSLVAGEPRIELVGPDYRYGEELGRAGVFSERIAYATRYFIPTEPAAAATAIEAITKSRPVTSLEGGAGPQFSPRQTGPVQFSPRREEDRTPLYSALTRAVEGVKQEKATPGQWISTLKNMAGVKPEERAWTGLDEWLGKQPKSVTRGEVLDYLRANALDVREVTKGGDTGPGEFIDWAERQGIERARANIIQHNVGAYLRPEQQALWDRWKAARDAYEGAKYRQYTLPGGKDYREMLITLPNAARPYTVKEIRLIDGDPAWEVRTPTGALHDTHAMPTMAGQEANRLNAAQGNQGYRSSHWDEPNVLAHVRFAEHEAPDGKRVLLIEETQSDWLQSARKHGMVGDEGASAGAVPRAPFKTTWPALAMKRMIQFAVDHGFDRVAWVPGETQADRYSLAKHLDRIEYEPSDEAGKYEIAAYDKAGKMVINEDEIGLDRIETIVGKEIAQKIADDAGEPRKDAPLRDWRVLSNLDLKVGGEGMKGFYDRQLPNEVQKIVGKFGAKVGQSEVSRGPSPDEITPNQQIGVVTSLLAGADRAEQAGERAYASLLKNAAERVRNGTPDQIPAALRALPDPAMEYFHRAGGIPRTPEDILHPVHSFDVTDQLREAVQTQGLPLFSPRQQVAVRNQRETEQWTPQELAFYTRVGRVVTVPTWRERLASLTDDLGRRSIRSWLDPYIGIKADDPAGYMALRNANTTAGATEMFLTDGTLKFNGSAYAMDSRNGGVEHYLIRPLHGEEQKFIWWVAANRAERLSAEDRENLWSQEDIEAGKATNQGQVPFDYTLSNGQITRSREAVYLDSLQKLDVFNKNVLDLGVQSGLLDGDKVSALFSNPFYVPFYRVADTDGHFAGPNLTSGFVKQYAFKQLKGGTQALRNDLWDNAIKNWSHMIDASLRNKAASGVLDVGVTNGAVTELSARDLLNQTKAEAKNTVWVMNNGQKQSFHVDDPMLFTAISALSFSGFNNPVMNALTKFKTIFTQGLTADPRFMLRVSIRDAEQAIATAPLSYNAAKNVITGFQMADLPGAINNVGRALAGRQLERLKLGDEAANAIAGGGTMRLGSGHDTGGRTTDLSTMLDKPGSINAFWHRVSQIARAYKEVTAQGEDTQRFALYHKLIADGVPHDQAAFAARDLEDFTLKGAGGIARFLTQTVPFWNAWMQGLYKVGRSVSNQDRNLAGAVAGQLAASTAKRVGIVLAATSMATLALDALYADDEDYKKRTDYDRDSNFWFKFGGVQFRIPMGFEVAAMSRIAANGAEALFGLNEMTGRRFVNTTLQIFGTNMSMSPIPQAVRPIWDVASNQSGTGSPIVSEGMNRLRPEEQYNPATTLPARWASSGLNAATRFVAGPQAQFPGGSPVQLDYLINGYLGWLGSHVINMADIAIRGVDQAQAAVRDEKPFEPVRPSVDLWNSLSGGMVSTETTPQSRYVDMLYQQAEGVRKAYATWKDKLARGHPDDARDFYAANKEQIDLHSKIETLTAAETTFNQQIKRVGEDTRMSGEQKRLEIMRYNAMRNRVAEGVFGTRQSAP
jgi:hypothetical protein